MAEKHPCEGCFYFGGCTVEVRGCNYYLMTNKRRPCPAGEGCTVRKEYKGKKTKAMTVKKSAK